MKFRRYNKESNGGGTSIRGNTEPLTPKTLESHAHPSIHNQKVTLNPDTPTNFLPPPNLTIVNF